MYSYKTSGICARQIDFDIVDNKVKNVKFYGGCDGNHKGICSLIEGMDKEDAVKRLKGITCGFRNTSCPDQLAKALEEINN